MFEQLNSQVSSSVAGKFFVKLNDQYRGNLILIHTLSGGLALIKRSDLRKYADAFIVSDPDTAEELGFVGGYESKLWTDYRRGQNPFKHVDHSERFVPKDDNLIIADNASPVDRMYAVVTQGDCTFITKRNGKYAPLDDEDLRTMASINEPISDREWNTINAECNEWIASYQDRMASYEYDTRELAQEMREYLDSVWNGQRDMRDHPESIEFELADQVEQHSIKLFTQAKNIDQQIESIKSQIYEIDRKYRKEEMLSLRSALCKKLPKLILQRDKMRSDARKWRGLRNSIETYTFEREAGGFEEQIFKHGGLLRDMTKNAWDVIFDGAETE